MQPDDATTLMNAAAEGDKASADRLLPLVYDQLRRAAQLGMAGERRGHTLSATALVHEAYLRLVGPRQVPWAGRAHFYAAAAEAMRRILIDYARSRPGNHPIQPGDEPNSAGPRQPISLSQIADVEALAKSSADQILAVDAAFTRLEAEDPQAAALVRLRFFAGLGVDQAAEALGLSPRSAARLWNYARALLYRYAAEAGRRLD